MQLSDVVNQQWLNAKSLSKQYAQAAPFSHIVLKDFLKPELLAAVADEFPDLAKEGRAAKHFDDDRQVKYASKGMRLLTPSALHLNGYLQSDLFLQWLSTLTGVSEPLIADPYLAGGGYHEIKRGGLLKVHADFNKHPKLDLDRRLNMLIYLNQDWDPSWGGGLQLFDETMSTPITSVSPHFNTAVIFTTTSFTYHGHPDPLQCPEQRSRRSLAYYYFSTGRPQSEVSQSRHSTLFKERDGEVFAGKKKSLLKRLFTFK